MAHKKTASIKPAAPPAKPNSKPPVVRPAKEAAKPKLMTKPAAKPASPTAAKAAVAKAAAVKREAPVAVAKAGVDAKTIKKPLQPVKVVAKPNAGQRKPAVAPTQTKTNTKVSMTKPAAVSKSPVAQKPVVVAKAPGAGTPETAGKAPAALVRQSGTKPVPAKPAPAAGQHSATAKALLEQRAAAHPPKAPAAITAPATPKDLAQKVAQAQQQQSAAAAAKKPVSTRHGFKTNEWIVYPAHGVGRIVAIEEQEIANMSLELFVITFEKDKMTLRVPTGKAQTVGMRKLADEGIVKRAMETLKGKARIKRTMWSRRAQEFEAKINSGDLVSIAEVVRDLFRADNQPEQSYSERQLYEAALDRMAREIAAVDKLDERGAVQRITEVLVKSAKGRRAAAEELSGDAAIEAA
jgi:CarD family transcriptional regulator